ncbi:hypothetical protein [Rhizorhabdus histidinilytica]|uniref:hypothetical protein n=1 Tax=Rhizorhabdus histidinilytica TaxID=439228 RepID=UPI0032201DDA
MSKRLDVNKAELALLKAALPGAEVKGLDNDAAFPDRVPPNGLVILRAGNPGEAEVTLSPLTYHWEHRSPVEVAAYSSATATNSEALDAMLVAIGAAVVADRTLGGLVDWLDVEPASPEDLAATGAKPAKGEIIMLVASYATTNPLN